MKLVFFVEGHKDMRVMAAWMVFCVSLAAYASGDWREKVGPEHAPEEIEPIHAPFDMPQLERPVFCDAVFSITDYGAVPGGEVKNTEAIRAAITACSESGGGVVRVPAGVWLTGAIHLESHVNLRLEQDAVLRFSDDPEDYLPVVFTRWAGFECYNYSPLIYARDCEDIAVTGPGTLEGNGVSWWPWFERQEATATRMYQEQILQGVLPEGRVYGTPEAGLRPQFISPINCTNVLLEGFTIAQPGPFWTIDLVYCDRVIVRKLRVMTEGGPNTDGLNVDSSRHVLIEHCLFNTGDDCICMKSGMNEDGWRVGRPTENVVARYNRTCHGHGGAVFGSDTSGGIRNVYVHSSIFDGTDLGIRLKSTRGRGGVVEQLWFEDIDMIGLAGDAVQIKMDYRAWMGTTEGKVPVFREMSFRNIKVNGAAQAMNIEGLPESLVQGLRFEDIHIQAKKGIQTRWVEGMALEHAVVE